MEIQYQRADLLIYLWLIIPFLALSIWAFWNRRNSIRNFFSKSILSKISVLSNPYRYIVRDVLIIASIALIVVSLARPRILGNNKEIDMDKGVKTIFCLDISNSMLSKDVAPSRLELAKSAIKRIIEKRSNDHIGIVVFAGSAYTLLPLSSDLSSALDFLSSIQPNMISDQGTNISSAIEIAMNSLSKDKEASKQIVVITDGEDQIGDASIIASKAKEEGIIVNVIGIGSESGGPIPIDNDYIRDERGEIVISKFNKEIGENIAHSGGGTFITSMLSDKIASMLIEQIESMPQTNLKSGLKATYIEKYYLYLWPAFIILILELFILERKNLIFKKINLFGREEK